MTDFVGKVLPCPPLAAYWPRWEIHLRYDWKQCACLVWVSGVENEVIMPHHVAAVTKHRLGMCYYSSIFPIYNFCNFKQWIPIVSVAAVLVKTVADWGGLVAAVTPEIAGRQPVWRYKLHLGILHQSAAVSVYQCTGRLWWETSGMEEELNHLMEPPVLKCKCGLIWHKVVRILLKQTLWIEIEFLVSDNKYQSNVLGFYHCITETNRCIYHWCTGLNLLSMLACESSSSPLNKDWIHSTWNY